MPLKTTVGLPVYNEAENLGALLEFLLGEKLVDRVVVVDDRSTDRSFSIARDYAARDSRVLALQNAERSGQLAGWLAAARAAETRSITFVDADARPGPGAIAVLAGVLEDDSRTVISSGRCEPDPESGRRPAARFRADVLHRVRLMQFPKEAVIGRFFSVARDWFIAATSRSDIIANDAYLGGLARRQGFVARYEPRAVCRYVEAQTIFDFAAQRQRADAGYAQLREMGVLQPADEPRAVDYLRCFAAAAVRNPIGASAWAVAQLRSRGFRAYTTAGRDAGAWEIQATTKRRVG